MQNRLQFAFFFDFRQINIKAYFKSINNNIDSKTKLISIRKYVDFESFVKSIRNRDLTFSISSILVNHFTHILSKLRIGCL